MSCSFIVTDARKFDNPIVYCSATFERLTGYSKHEILGRNCRFLQAPDGDVGAGVKRKYVDDDTVSYLKQQIDAKKEAQASLINYRKGGQPFMNLLTTIPITWDSDEVVYFVGFQVDLVEQPGSVINRNQGNSNKLSYHFGFSNIHNQMGLSLSIINTPSFRSIFQYHLRNAEGLLLYPETMYRMF